MTEEKVKDVSGALKRGVGGVGGVAGEALKKTGSAVRGATGAVSGATGKEAVDDVGKRVQEAARSAGAAVERAGRRVATGSAGAQRTMGEELREIVREAALEVLVPAARRASAEAAKYAIARAPEIAPKLAGRLGPAIEKAGGPTAFAKDALSSIASARTELLEKVRLGGEAESRPWRERRLPVEESIDVAAPLEATYDRFTEFDEYATVMSSGETVDERRNERLTWRRTDHVADTAVITFHRLSHRLTRVMVTYDHEPQGLLEKTTSLFRSSRRGLHADLMRFRAFVELSLEDAETPESGEEAEPEEEYEEEPGAEYEQEPEGEEGAGPPPRPHRPVRRRPAPRQPTARRR